MNILEFNFRDDSFNRLFPFYILIDKSLQIQSFGKSLSKICPFLEKATFFSDNFDIKRPNLTNPTFDEIIINSNQLTVIENKTNGMSLRGQFELMNNSLLFVGSPWFNSMQELAAKKLTLHDFAVHDPLIDLLHVLNNQENTSKELKELLMTINNQKNKLKKDKEELNRLSLVASANENGVLFTNPEGKIFWCNEAYLALTGFTKEEILAKTPIEVGRSDYTDKESLKKMAELFLKGEIFDLEIIHGRKDGSYFWTRTKGQPVLNSNGEVTQYFAMIEDITIKKQYGEGVEKEKEKYSRIIANMNLGLVEVDNHENIIFANNSFSEISGYPIDELIGKNAPQLLMSDVNKKELQERVDNRKKGISDTYEIDIINKKGEKRHLLISGAPNYNFNGEVLGSIGIHLDITKQKLQEEQLYLLSLIAEKNINAVVISDNQGRLEWANHSFFEMTGYSIQEMLGKKPGAILQGPETDPETIAYLKDRIKKGLPFNCELINYSKSGQKYWTSIQGQALYNKDNEIVKYFAIEEDITNKKLLENQREQLVQSLAISNKELEDYAHIVSHDLKSPLRSIHSLVSWIREDNEKELSAQTLNYFSMIENKVEKMDHLIEGILTYAKIDKINVTQEKVNIDEIIQNIINIIHIPENATVQIKNQLPIVKGDRFRMQQLFQNLISNALNHNDKEQTLVEIDCKETNQNFIFTVKDNGPGIPKEDQERIFNIFQSLTNNDKSTGLGLSIVKKIIESYQGEICVESELKQGTTFFIKFNKQ